MRKYVGELSKIGAPIYVIFDSSHSDLNRILLGSLTRVFDGFLNLQFIDINSKGFLRRAKSLLKKGAVIISITQKFSEFMPLLRHRENVVVIGFFSEIDSLTKPEMQALQTSYDRIVKIDSSLIIDSHTQLESNKITSVNLALDLRRFYNLNRSTRNESPVVGMIVDDLSILKLISLKSEIGDFLSDQPDVKLLLCYRSCSEDALSLLQSTFENPRVRLMDYSSNIETQITFFEDIDYFVRMSNCLSESENVIQSSTAGIPIFDLSDLLNHDEQLQSYRKVSDFIDYHPLDFRLLKFQYLKSFFGNNLFSSTQRELVVVPADAGFFSVFNTFISIRAHWLGVHGFSSIIPDWSVAQVLDFWKIDDLTSYCYAGETEGNVFLNLFQNFDSHADLSNELSIKIPEKNEGVLFVHSPNLNADPDFTYVFADRLYRSAGFQVWRNEMNKALGELKPNKRIISQIENLFADVSQNAFLIGMHVRHPSHAMEQPNSEIPFAEDFIRVAKDLMRENSRNSEDVRVFLATDQDIVVDAFRAEFKDKLIVFEGVTRVTTDQSKDFQNMTAKQQLAVGNQIQHLAAKNRSRWSSVLAEEIIRDAWALSRCELLIHAVSNVATAVTYLNPNLESIPISRGDTLKIARDRKFLAQETSLI